MCGISFILDKKGILNEEPVQRMRASLHHRGPDASSFYRHSTNNSQLFFAANRLSIVEKSDAANQPFFASDGTALLLFNGEIYNFFDLKNELLQTGARFTTHSDTEVLLYWLKTFGAGGISRLNGMFAFLYYDLAANRLTAARDRFGMKPLYYYNDNRYLIISSEIKGIFSTGLVEKELNRRQIPHYFTFKYPSPPETFYKNVFQVAKGTFLEVSGSDPSPSNFCNSSFDNAQHPGPDIKSFKEKIKESVLKHAYAGSEVGLLLSGGIDSALILLLAHEEGIKLPSFSVFAPENKKERQLAEGLTRQTSSEHQVLTVDATILNDFEEYVSRLDQPIADSAGLLTWKICREASPRVKALLSGAGADELFAGYNRHSAYAFYLKHRKNLLRFKKYLWPATRGIAGMKSRNLGLFFANIDENEKATFLNFVSSHFNSLRSDVKTFIQNDNPERHYLQWALAYDRNNYLPDDVLSISDAMSMQAGVEMRMPFLDNDLLDMVNNCGGTYLIDGGRKWILREILKDYVSPSFLKQKKQGFGLPLRHWLRSSEHDHLWELFRNKNSLIFSFLDRNFINNLIASHKKNRRNHEQELWSVLTLAHWLKQEFE